MVWTLVVNAKFRLSGQSTPEFEALALVIGTPPSSKLQIDR